MRHIYLIIAFTLLVPIYLNLQLELTRQRLKFDESVQQGINGELPVSSPWVLNYKTLTADIAWLDTLIRHGELKRNGLSPQDTLLVIAKEIAATDPYFYPIYEWVPAAYMIPRHQLTEDELLNVAGLMDIGIQTFPRDSQLPFSAAMNFIGKSDLSDKSRRIRELSKAIAYLKVSADRPNAREDLPALISALSKRVVELKGDNNRELIPLAVSLEQRRFMGSHPDVKISYLRDTLGHSIGVE
jgi:hypothetical protein